jgi:hypothetical protein
MWLEVANLDRGPSTTIPAQSSECKVLVTSYFDWRSEPVDWTSEPVDYFD